MNWKDEEVSGRGFDCSTDRFRAKITIGHQVVFRTKQMKCVIFNRHYFRQILFTAWGILHVSV
jgi:hypothetical protein